MGVMSARRGMLLFISVRFGFWVCCCVVVVLKTDDNKEEEEGREILNIQ